jgi:hypothetical protein
MQPKLNLPGTKRLKLTCDVMLSTSAFKFNLHRYTKVYSKSWSSCPGPEAGACTCPLFSPT